MAALMEVEVDERLRELELGILDGLTSMGIRSLHPRRLPAANGWASSTTGHPAARAGATCSSASASSPAAVHARLDGERIWVFSHQAVILAFRVALEGLTKREVLDIDSSTRLGNCSMTRSEPGASGGWKLTAFDDVSGSVLAPETRERPATQQRGEEDGADA